MPTRNAVGRLLGGKRAGAGRKKGSPNKRTQAAVAKAERTGKMPLDIMLQLMRRAMAAGEKAEKAKLPEAEEHYTTAFERAAQAAPYLHSKLQSITQKDERIDLGKLTDEEIEFLYRIKLKGAEQHPAA